MNPKSLVALLASRCRAIRLETNEPQRELAARAGISVATLKRFEASGHITSEGLMRILHALGRESGLIESLNAPASPTIKPSLSQLIASSSKPRIRARSRQLKLRIISKSAVIQSPTASNESPANRSSISW